MNNEKKIQCSRGWQVSDLMSLDEWLPWQEEDEDDDEKERTKGEKPPTAVIPKCCVLNSLCHFYFSLWLVQGVCVTLPSPGSSRPAWPGWTDSFFRRLSYLSTFSSNTPQTALCDSRWDKSISTCELWQTLLQFSNHEHALTLEMPRCRVSPVVSQEPPPASPHWIKQLFLWGVRVTNLEIFRIISS